MGGGRSCSVIGCQNRSGLNRDLHFYLFPQDPVIRDIWLTFSRRAPDYVVKKSSYICQDHFDPSCIVVKKKQIALAKNSVPTIFYRNTIEGGVEKIVLTFDTDVMHYVEEDTLLNPVYDREKHEADLLAKRERKLKEMLRLCRFCLEHSSDDKLIAISELTKYAIDPIEMVRIAGLDVQYNDYFGKSACEECFQQLCTIDGYRKRCVKAQERLISELEDLDNKIQKIRGDEWGAASSWMKAEQPWTEEYENEHERQTFEAPVRNQEAELSFQRIIVKEERGHESMSEDEDYLDEYAPSPDCGVKEERLEDEVEERIEELEEDEMEQQGEGEVDRSTEIIAEGKGNALRRVYECYYCNYKFAGKRTFTKHCQSCTAPKRLVCPDPNCDKVFSKLSGFNVHLVAIHRMQKRQWKHCKICKMMKILTEDDFKTHKADCEKSSIQEIDNPVTCETCGKVCPSTKSFAIHMMFHKTGNKSFDYEPKNPKSKKRERGIFICETCGKEFATKFYLTDHVRRMHTITATTGQFMCDFCGKSKKDKYQLAKHIKNVHVVNPTPCKVCGKVFRNPPLMQAHQLVYHNESKRIHFCPLCPHKPPYVTAVALKRHQESNHGINHSSSREHLCDICGVTYKSKQGVTQHKESAHGIVKRTSGRQGFPYNPSTATQSISETTQQQSFVPNYGMEYPQYL